MDTDLLDPTDCTALLAVRRFLDQGLLTGSDITSAYAQGGMACLEALVEQRRPMDQRTGG